jgi:hypothetical protein
MSDNVLYHIYGEAMDTDFVDLIFEPASEEPFHGFVHSSIPDARNAANAIKAAGGRLVPVIRGASRDAGLGPFLMEYALPLAQVVGPVIGGAAAAWLQGRAGRKLRLKVGDIEVEARTVEEVDQLLLRAQALRAGQPEANDEA